MRKIVIAIVLSGSGVYDGSEIHEAVCAMLAVENNGAEYAIFAPDIEQHHVINHLTGEEMNESRNVLVESARIARGNIKPLSQLNKLEDIDAILLPGGFGAAKNLSDYAFKGEKVTVLPELEQILKKAHEKGTPIGALCISPILLAKIISGTNLTLGDENNAAKDAEHVGAKHTVCGNGEICVDTANRIVSSPCYMVNATIADVAKGADLTVKALIKLHASQ